VCNLNNEYNGVLMSILDNDTYKFTMQQVVFHQFPQVEVEYEFKCRTDGGGMVLAEHLDIIRDEIYKMKDLKLTYSEEEWLRTIPFLKDDYIDFLDEFRFNPEKHVKIMVDDGDIFIKIIGPWVQTILYEVPILAILSEISSKTQRVFYKGNWKEQSIKNLDDKIKKVKAHNLGSQFKLVDFGTRRRSSSDNQDMVVRYCKEQFNTLGDGQFIGTSNMHLAKKYSLKPIGTMAHEYIMAFQVLSPIKHFQASALKVWDDEYDGDLGIALTDTINMDSFLKDFTLSKSKSYDGCRHDSGDPFIWGDKLIKHYKSYGIDPLTKSAVFSDGLDFDKALEILEYFNGKILVSFGIGTNLTNDCGVNPISIVIKMQKCQGYPVCKISDTPVKAMCQMDSFLNYMKDIHGIKNKNLTYK